MSTLNEIAANHAKKMAQALVEESALSERQPQVVGGFEISAIEAQHVPLHLIAGAQESPAGPAAGYML